MCETVSIQYNDDGTLTVRHGAAIWRALSAQASIDPAGGRVLTVEHLLDDPEPQQPSEAPKRFGYLDGSG